jgi:hypothetical protein
VSPRREPRRARRSDATAAARPPARRGPPRWSAFVAAAIVASIALAVVAARLRAPRRAPAPSALSALSQAALVDSLTAAEARHAWARSLVYMQEISARNPSNPGTLVALGLSWSNFAWSGSPYGRPRAAMRSSLDRVRLMRRAFALMDSADAQSTTVEARVLVPLQRGWVFEALGMPLDAVASYEHVLAIQPEHAEARQRLEVVVRRLHAPAAGASGGTPVGTR